MIGSKLALAWAGGAAVLLCAVGCTGPSSVNTAGPADRRAEPTPIEDERVITDPEFARMVSLVGLIEGRTESGLRIVEAEVMNRTRVHQAFRFRYSWYGADGLEVRSPTVVWRHESIPPGSLRRLTAIAPDHNAHDFRLELYSDN